MLVFYIRLYNCAEKHRRAIQKQFNDNQCILRQLTFTNPKAGYLFTIVFFLLICCYDSDTAVENV